MKAKREDHKLVWTLGDYMFHWAKPEKIYPWNGPNHLNSLSQKSLCRPNWASCFATRWCRPKRTQRNPEAFTLKPKQEDKRGAHCRRTAPTAFWEASTCTAVRSDGSKWRRSGAEVNMSLINSKDLLHSHDHGILCRPPPVERSRSVRGEHRKHSKRLGKDTSGRKHSLFRSSIHRSK